jgi:hypothetical protein
MRKKKSAKVLSPNQYVARNLGGQDLVEPGCLTTDEYVVRCWWAHDTADQLRKAMRSYKRAIGDVEKFHKWWFNLVTDSRAIARATDDLLSFAMFLDNAIEDGSSLADSLRLVADALEGKLRGAKNDERYLEAYFQAQARSENSPPPLFSEVWDALTSLSGTSRVSTKRNDTEPLTEKEKKAIRWHESGGWQHAAIEDLIGKRYKRTDTGDLVAINENGDVRGRTPKLNEDALKDDLRRRLKILGCPVSPDKRSRWRQRSAPLGDHR